MRDSFDEIDDPALQNLLGLAQADEEAELDLPLSKTPLTAAVGHKRYQEDLEYERLDAEDRQDLAERRLREVAVAEAEGMLNFRSFVLFHSSLSLFF